MKSSRIADCSLLTVAIALSRFLFRSRYLYDLDSVNFALALDRFDVAVHQPHPPGYFLYVCLGRLFLPLFGDANNALVAISILASCGAVVAIYVLTDGWFGRRAAVAAGLLFLFSPLCWFHGTVALTYIVECFTSALVGHLCWQSYCGRKSFVVPSAVVLGLATGVRPSSFLMLAPLWAFSARKAGRRRLACGLLALALVIAAWLIPMLVASGGPARYWNAAQTLWSNAAGSQNDTNGIVAMSMARLVIIGLVFLLCLGAAAPFLLAGPRLDSAAAGKKLFTWVWVLPGLAFFTLVFLLFVNSGYLLVISPPAFAWIGARAAAWCSDARKAAIAVALAAANTAIYLWIPLYCSHRSVTKFEKELVGITSSIRKIARPRECVILGFDAHFLGFRHAAYYLPEFLTLVVPRPASRILFSAQYRSTSLVKQAPLDRFPKFLVFLHPAKQQYQKYLDQLRPRLRDGALQKETIDGQEFLMGDSRDLAPLFALH